MKNNGHALVEFVLCLWIGVFFLSGTAFLRHFFKVRSAALALCAFGSQLASHPGLSFEDRKFHLENAAKRLSPCSQCRFSFHVGRFLGLPSARFYDLTETTVLVEVGHRSLRRLLAVPQHFSESAVVLQEPSREI
jgi:hypothetical protein